MTVLPELLFQNGHGHAEFAKGELWHVITDNLTALLMVLTVLCIAQTGVQLNGKLIMQSSTRVFLFVIIFPRDWFFYRITYLKYTKNTVFVSCGFFDDSCENVTYVGVSISCTLFFLIYCMGFGVKKIVDA